MPDHSPIRLCVYCGSNTGTSPAFAATAARLGTSLANRGIGLVFGGGRVGLMGLAADAALQAGGEVIGVITEQLVDEFAEMLTWNQLGIVAKPVVLLDIEGFWAPMLAWMDKAVECGFVRPAHRMLAQRAVSVDEAIAMATSPVPDTPHKWLDRDATPARGASVPKP